MARLLRVSSVGVAQHIIQRGNNRQICFGNEEDIIAYVTWLKEYSKKYHVEVHAWVLMTNHVHLLCTPREKEGISKMMQSIGRLYVRYFNKSYKRSGTLWEGRYKSCLVQDEDYLLEVYRYIELNPVRADMVADPSDYKWSSYQCNALGVKTDLCTAHSLYTALGNTQLERNDAYRDLFKVHVEETLLKEIRSSVNKGLALGNAKFKEDIELLTKRRVTAKQVGRPKREK
ncbi:MAG: transposase [Gammaproteobacteria bacterium]|nr:transposase [Gammaproteobacteria bacterium]